MDPDRTDFTNTSFGTFRRIRSIRVHYVPNLFISKVSLQK